MKKSKRGLTLSPFFVFVLIGIIILIAIVITVLTQQETILPGSPAESTIMSFIKIHDSLFGKYEKTEPLPDWSEGEQKKVTTSLGSFLFYLKAGEVVVVDQYQADGSRKNIWRKE